jgi:hypothetical protein
MVLSSRSRTALAEEAQVHAGVLGPQIAVVCDGELVREDILVAVPGRAVDEEDAVLEQFLVRQALEESQVGGGQVLARVVHGLGSRAADLVRRLPEGVAVVVASDRMERDRVELLDGLVGAGAVADDVAEAEHGGDLIL